MPPLAALNDAVIHMTTLMNEMQAAAYLGGLSERTLQRWRMEGCGPQFRKIGRLVRYAENDLADFLASTRRASTSEAVNG